MDSSPTTLTTKISEARLILWGSAELDGAFATVRVSRVLSGLVESEAVTVDLGLFADQEFRTQSAFVLDGENPANVLVNPANPLLTPARIDRLLRLGIPLADDPLGAATISAAAQTATGAFEVEISADDEGLLAEVTKVLQVFVGVGPQAGDVLHRPAGADWDFGAGRLRRHIVASLSGDGQWVLSLRPFGPADDKELGWAEINADQWAK